MINGLLLILYVCTELQKQKLQTHPFPFLSLRPFGSCKSVKTTVTLHKQRKVVILCIWTKILHKEKLHSTYLGTDQSLFSGGPWGPRRSDFPLENRESIPVENQTVRSTYNAYNTRHDACFSSPDIHRTCSPFLPGRPDRPGIPASPYSQTLIHLMFKH